MPYSYDRRVNAKTNLSDQELAALHAFVMYKSFARAEYLKRVDVEYSPADPIIKGLMDKGFLKMQGKALIPDRSRISRELAQHEAPEKYNLENAWTVFNKGGR